MRFPFKVINNNINSIHFIFQKILELQNLHAIILRPFIILNNIVNYVETLIQFLLDLFLIDLI